MIESYDMLNEVNSLLREKTKSSKIQAASLIQLFNGGEVSVKNSEDAWTFLNSYWRGLLEAQMYLEAGVMNWGYGKFDPRPWFVQRIFEHLPESSKTLVMAASSSSKCLGKGTMVRMFDGTAKKVEDVIEGDVLMGDDSKPRNVLSIARGREKLYRIKPLRGESWVCNESHILSLRYMPLDVKIKGIKHGDVIDVPLKEYLNWPKSRKNLFKQFSVGVDYEEKDVPFDPYLYGAWIADGSVGIPAIHKPLDKKMIQWCNKYMASLGYRVKIMYEDRCPSCFYRHDAGWKNPFIDFINSSYIDRQKRILPEYLINSRENRLKLLAGMIDGDGSLQLYEGKPRNSVSITTKYEGLAKDIYDLARSLGFYAGIKPRKGVIKKLNFEGNYFCVHISGKMMHEVPTLDKIFGGESRTEPTNIGFDAEPLGQGDYYGFTIDGNHRFLLGDYTVTHNTYGIVCWLYLDYQRDPEYTSIKCIAVNEAQLRRNIFTHLYDIHEASIMEVAGASKKDLFLGEDVTDLDSGFEGITTPQGQQSSGRVKGIKPKQRPSPHPVFGIQTRLRIFVDEFQNVAEGVEKDFSSPLSSAEGNDRVKIILSGNPEDASSLFGQLAEPPEGWLSVDIEEDWKWTSKRGYNVLRLDGARSENVIAKKEVYPGILSYQGFQDHLLKGPEHPEYYCFARGMFPLRGAHSTLIARGLLMANIGDATFHEGSTRVGAVDIALRNDRVILAYGRYGMATGYVDGFGQEQNFSKGTATHQKSRFLFQQEGFVEIEGFDSDAITLAQRIIEEAEKLNIEPRNFATDSTGLGEGVYSYLKNYWGPQVMAINWTSSPSENKVMREDAETPIKKYYKISDEMWFCYHAWLSFGSMLIARACQQSFFFDELANRRIGKHISGKRKMESKDEYKLRNRGVSPDYADSAIMIPQLIRATSGFIPSMNKEGELVKQNNTFKSNSIESIDSLRYNSLKVDKAKPKPFNLEDLKRPSRTL